MILLKEIAPSSIRGIPHDWGTLRIKPGGVLVYGPNGCGKSSFVDAIEYFLTGTSSLFAENRRGVTWERAAPHLQGGAYSSQITLQVGDQTHEVRSTIADHEVPNSIHDWLRIAAGAQFVLRRHMLLRFVACDPASRYAALAPFLNLDSYHSIEESLATLKKAFATKLAQSDARLDAKRQILRNAFELGPQVTLDTTTLFSQLVARFRQLGLPEPNQPDAIPECASAIKSQLAAVGGSDRLQQLGALKQQIARIPSPRALRPILVRLSEVVAQVEERDRNQQGRALLAVLRPSSEFLATGDAQTCPVCEQSIDRARVAERLNDRIRALSTIEELETTSSNLVEELRKSIALQATGISELYTDWKQADIGATPAALTSFESFLRHASEFIESDSYSVSSVREVLETLEGLPGDLREASKAIDTAIGSEDALVRFRRLTVLASMCEAHARELPAYLELVARRAVLDKQLELVERVYTHSSDSRKVAVQHVLDRVSGLANHYYEVIHPDEGLSSSSLSVKESARSSLELTAQFHGSEEHPLLHYSESHLDTLGLVYFLALRRRESETNQSFRLLVLDDVIHSIDSDHRGRVSRLLRDEFADHQLIITTHDPIFFDRLKERFSGRDMGFVRLGGWTLEKGPLLIDSKSDLERVTSPALRNTLEHQNLAAASGRFMEMLCRRLTESLWISVRARFEARHVLGDLWPPLAAKLKKHKGFSASHRETIDEIDASVWVRNECGAHHNEAASPPTPAETRALAQALADLHRATFCGSCGSYIMRRENKDWSCPCSGHRYSAQS